MIKQEEGHLEKDKKTYTGADLIEETKKILMADTIGKKLPAAALEKLSKLLAKTVLKGDL